MQDPELNKKNTMDFYHLMFNECIPREAIDRYTGDRYIQHNPYVGDGKEEFIKYFNRAIAEDKYVVLHCRQEWPGDNDYAGIDIFRLDDKGKIVEHWDVLQPLSGKSENDNGMF